MTENEAIKILKNITEHTKVYEDDVVFTSDFAKAYEIAIQSLEEIQQYRAIGTIEEFKALKEKSVAKQPRWHGHHFCPHCDNIVFVNGGKNRYCTSCGQKLDWSE